jgi:hypothetical protein
MPCSSCDRIQQKTTTPVGEEEGDRWSKEVSHPAETPNLTEKVLKLNY